MKEAYWRIGEGKKGFRPSKARLGQILNALLLFDGRMVDNRCGPLYDRKWLRTCSMSYCKMLITLKPEHVERFEEQTELKLIRIDEQEREKWHEN